ncbi:MAG: CDP-glycerol glycerophosphotransferase family protein, partial [Lachnospiraceae bacterium]|nr:CDP-glycerol glycerophosphotransferase family protein [Lachnospiraceae bacterium]
FLEEKNLIMVCKLHPKSAVKKEFENINFSNIYNVPSEVDVNSFLREVDILVADYSSAYSDFMMLDRPVVAFHYDYEEYAGDTRDAYFDFDEYMPEIKATNMEELMQGLAEVLDEDRCREARTASCEKIFKYKDALACERLEKRILEML